MAALKLGDTVLQLAVPDDLDARLQASVGCSASEVCGMLGRRPLAGFVAAALLPLLTDPPIKSDLARLIADAGVDKVRQRLLSVYRAATRPKKQKKEEAGHDEEQSPQQ